MSVASWESDCQSGSAAKSGSSSAKDPSVSTWARAMENGEKAAPGTSKKLLAHRQTYSASICKSLSANLESAIRPGSATVDRLWHWNSLCRLLAERSSTLMVTN